MINAKNTKFRFIALLLCALLVISGLVPVMGGIRVKATNNITIYFDTSGSYSTSQCSNTSSHGTHGWSKSMTTVYYYAYKKGGSAHTGLSAMTPTGVEGTDGGMIFSTTIDTDAYDRVLFSSVNPWGYDGDDKLWQTQGISISASSDKHRFITNGSTLNDPDDSYRHTQNVYDAGSYTLQTNNGDQWALANYTSSNVTLYLIYSTKAGVTEVKNYTVNAYTLHHDISVPEHDPTYTSVEIHKDSATGTLLKTYTLGTEKIPGSQPKGNVFIYGVTEYAETHSGIDGDGKVLNYWHARCDTTSAVSKKLYLSLSSFSVDDYSASNFVLKNKNGTPYTFEAVTSDGNASFATTSKVSAVASDVLTLEVTKNGQTDKYHMVWDIRTNNLIEKPNDAALVSGKYSASSTIDGGITVDSEIFDYLYSGSGDNNPVISDTTSGKLKRPYVYINNAISSSEYASSITAGFNKTLNDDTVKNKPPMYLGGFWSESSTPQNVFNDDNAVSEKAGRRSGDDYGNTLTNFRYGANLAFRPENQASGDSFYYNTVAQGLVDSKLSGDIDSGYTLTANGKAVPYFNLEWWSTQTSYSSLSNYIRHADNVAFPFYSIPSSEVNLNNGYMLSSSSNKYKGTYYVFDSSRDVVHINIDAGEVDSRTHNALDSAAVFDGYGDGVENNKTQRGVFPFNSPNAEQTPDDQRSNLNYGFGIQYNFDFYLNDAGTLNGESDGIPITFTFKGDDDVWVFLDDKLILDMGGDHKEAAGEINFAEKKIYISQIGKANTNLIEEKTTGVKVDGVNISSATNPDVTQNYSATFASLGFANDSAYLKSGKHRLTMYYMERGMLNSNLYVMFNLPQDTTVWELQEDTDFSKVNDGFTTATQIVADNDVFNYTVENKGTVNTGMTSYYNYPTYELLSRTNSDFSSSNVTKLSGKNGGVLPTANTRTVTNTVTKTVYPTNRIYLHFGVWDADTPNYGAWMWGGSENNNMFRRVQYDNETEMYYLPNDEGYSGMILFRLDPSKTYPSDKSTSFDAVENIRWNRVTGDISIPSGLTKSNTYKVTGWDSGVWGGKVYTSGTASETITETYYDSADYQTNDFAANKNAFAPLIKDASTGVTYKLYDAFLSDNDVAKNTRKYNSSGDSNVISLQYGQMANFKNQFTIDSDMKVTQINELSAALNGTEKNVINNYNDTSTRLVSDYYDTYIKTNTNNTRSLYAGLYSGVDLVGIDIDHVEDMYDGVTNYCNESVANLQYTGTETTYKFRDPSDSSNRNVHLRQVFVNAVRTADLTIEKRIAFGESSSDSFTLHVYFSDVFGASYGDSQIGTISYTYYPNGGTAQNGNVVYNSTDGMSLSISAGDKIVITGIPVGTKYKITETYTGTPTYVLNEDESININANTPAEITGDTTAIVYNSRQTGKLDIYKRLYDENLSEITGSDMEFTVQLVLTNASVDIGNYSIIARSEGNVLAGTSIERITDPTDTKRLTLKMKIKGGVGKFIEVSGIPYGTTYAVQELTGSGFEFMNVSTAAYQDPTYNYAPGNAPVSGGNDYHIFKSINTSTVNDANVNKVTVVNKIIPIIMPTTGGSGIIFIFPLGILAITLSGAAFVIYTRRINSGKKAPKGRYVRK